MSRDVLYEHPTIDNYYGSRTGKVYGPRGLVRTHKQETGYYLFSIPGGAKSAHKFIYECVSGNMIPSGLQINHKDCDKSNNQFDNLEVVTASENMQHAADNDLITFQHGASSHYAKLTEEQAKEILIKCKIIPDKELAKEYDVTPKTVGRLRRRETWKHLGE